MCAVGCRCGVRFCPPPSVWARAGVQKIGAVPPPLRGGIDLDRPPLEGGATNCGLRCLRAPLSDSPLLLLKLLLCHAGVERGFCRVDAGREGWREPDRITRKSDETQKNAPFCPDLLRRLRVSTRSCLIRRRISVLTTVAFFGSERKCNSELTGAHGTRHSLDRVRRLSRCAGRPNAQKHIFWHSCVSRRVGRVGRMDGRGKRTGGQVGG